MCQQTVLYGANGLGMHCVAERAFREFSIRKGILDQGIFITAHLFYHRTIFFWTMRQNPKT